MKKLKRKSWKIPFLDLYVVPGGELRKMDGTLRLRHKIISNLLDKNTRLAGRLSRYEPI